MTIHKSVPPVQDNIVEEAENEEEQFSDNDCVEDLNDVNEEVNGGSEDAKSPILVFFPEAHWVSMSFVNIVVMSVKSH